MKSPPPERIGCPAGPGGQQAGTWAGSVIDSPRNPQLRALAQWNHSARQRRKDGVVVLEGEHLVRAWLDSGRPLLELWVAAERCSQPPVQRLLERVREPTVSEVGTPRPCRVRRLSAALLGSVSSLPSPPEVTGVAFLNAAPLPPSIDCDVLVLDRVQDPANVGAILRTAAAAGIGQAVTLPGTAECWSPKALRAGMGGQFVLQIAEGVPWSRLRTALAVPAVALVAHGGQPLHGADLCAPRAWVFGNEGQGLHPDIAADLDQRLTIDQAAGVESLNVAAAVAVCAFEQRRQRGPRPGP